MKKIILICLTLVTLICSCKDDRGEEPVIPKGETQVDLNLLSTGISVKGGNGNNEEISELVLLIFNGKGDEAVYDYSRHAWKKSNTQNVFTTTLKTGTDLTICFVANASSLIDGLPENVLQKGNTWADIVEHLVMAEPTKIGEGVGLPMWGIRSGQTIVEEANAHLGTITLLRSVAAIDVDVTADNFTWLSAYTVYAANKGYLAYDPDNIRLENDIPRLKEPWSPPGFNTNVDLQQTVNSGSIPELFYVYENETPLEPANAATRPTKVVLYGTWSKGKGQPTYYPLSLRNFNQKTGEFDKKQVTRNNKYSIIVTHVNGDGYEKLEDAKLADDVNVIYDVINWEGNNDGQIFIDGPKYIYVASFNAKLARNKDRTAEIIFRTNFSTGDIKMKFPEDADFTKGNSINTHLRFKVEVLTGQGDADNPYDCFRITTKQDYGTNNNPAVLTVVLGRIEFEITMEQFDKDPADWNDGQDIIVDFGS